MRWWDESMFAVNTYEMMHNGNYFTPYFNGVPDGFNTKPPLTIWVQMVFVKLIGYNELALRLPSALAAGLTVVMLFHFLAKNYSVVWAWFSALILLTSSGFVHFHTARTADSDALLTFFLLASNICFVKYYNGGHSRNILMFVLFISLAFSTKMYAALLFIPAYFYLLFLDKKIKETFFNKYFLAGCLFFVLTNTLLIVLRELQSPGYVREILFKDAGRIFTAIEKHNGSIFFYFDNLFRTRFSIWIVLLIPGFFFAFYNEDLKAKKLLSISVILVFSYLLIISLSVTKLEWYDMPLYPLFALICGYSIWLLLKLIIKEISPLKIAGLTLMIFIYPYSLAFRKSQSNPMQEGEQKREACEAFIFKSNIENKNLGNVKVYSVAYNGGLIFYKYKMARLDQPIELVTKPEFKIKDKVLVCDDSLITVLKKNYDFKILDSFGSAQLLQVENLISQNTASFLQ
jgi:4-amino-4-deoxy-L-arabinose transferase-like glycosyltransferase